MRVFLALLWVFCLAETANAEVFSFWRDAGAITVKMPPNKWLINPPLAPITVYPAQRTLVAKMCGHNENIGCAVLGSFCMIYIDKNLDPVTYGAVLRHEGAHCRGWPGDHPQD